MISYIIICLSSILIFFPRRHELDYKSFYSLIFSTFSFSQALQGFISLILIVIGLSKFPVLIFAFCFLLISLLKTKNPLGKFISTKDFLINEINLFFLENSKSKFQRILLYISLLLLVLVFISSLGPINHPDAADYHVGYPFQYYLRGSFFVDGGLHQGLIGISDYANLPFIQENSIWLIRVLQIINLPILVLFLSKKIKNNFFLIAFLSIPTFIQWSTIGKPLFLGESSLIALYLIWRENKSLSTLKLLTISILNCICFKISSLIIIFPILLDVLFHLYKNGGSFRNQFKLIKKIIFSKTTILSILILISLLFSRYFINDNFAFPLFTKVFNRDDIQITEFSEMLKNYRRENFFFLNIFIPTKISDLSQSLGLFTSFTFITYIFKNLKEFKSRKNGLFLIFISQLLLLLFFCQGRPDYYAAPLIISFYQIGTLNQFKINLLFKRFLYITIIIQVSITVLLLIFSIFLNFNTAFEYNKNMNLSAYGYKNSSLIDQSMKGRILFLDRNTRLYYPTNYIDKDRINSCINEFRVNGKINSKDICLEKFNVTQIVNAWEDTSLEKNYECENINTIKATRNIFTRNRHTIKYCKKKKLSE